MKKFNLLLLLLVILVLAAAPVIKLARLSVVNKTEYDAYLRLTELPVLEEYFTGQEYYLHIRPGEVTGFDLWAVQVFTLVRGYYNVSASFCGQDWVLWMKNYDLTNAKRTIVIPPCGVVDVEDAVEDGTLKLSYWLYPPMDLLGKPIVYSLGPLPGFRWRY